MNRLDEIKARLNEVGSHHPDVVVLVSAVEAVLALHQPIDPDSIGRNRRCCSCSAVYGNAAYPCDTVQAIRQHIPEPARTQGDDQ